jgi:ribosomal protein S18 acetylase RimI-like enzyme
MQEIDREPGTLETDSVEIRSLTVADLDWVVRIDSEHSGQSRREYYQLKLEEAERDTGIRISLAALVDGEPVGFLMGRLYYGEFGLPEPQAILDSIAVSRAHAGHSVGHALMRQLSTNLRGLGIEKIQTQADWNQWALLRFFESAGFVPAPRVCLEMTIGRES